MDGLYLTMEEFNGLQGCSNLAFRLYVVLRRWMDLRTATVGRHGKCISYQGLREECEAAIPRGAGHQLVKPTLKEVRLALDGLERCGMISRLGGELLAFLLKKARVVSVRSNQTGQSAGRVDESENACAAMVSERTGQGKQAKPGIHQRSEVNNLSVVNAAAALSVDNFDPAPEKVLLPLHVQMASWLGEREKRRGKVLRVRQDDATVLGWVEAGATLEMLSVAYADAVADRELQNNPHPLNVAFLGIFMGRLLAGGSRASRRGQRAPQPWFFDNQAFGARAAELGMPMGPEDSRGRAWQAWRKRVLLAAGVARDEFVVACRDRGNGRVDWQFVESVWGPA